MGGRAGVGRDGHRGGEGDEEERVIVQGGRPRSRRLPPYIIHVTAEKTSAMDKAIQDATQSTVGWFAFATGTVGLSAGQTLRLSVVNLSAVGVKVLCALTGNPRPISLAQDSHDLGPGEAQNCDLKASDLSSDAFDKTGRAQIRAFVRSSSRTVCGTLEIFDSKTGRTSVALPRQEVVQRE